MQGSAIGYASQMLLLLLLLLLLILLQLLLLSLELVAIPLLDSPEVTAAAVPRYSTWDTFGNCP